jgi:ABC-type branched-subunit amino acid transport system substrate-binding protein
MAVEDFGAAAKGLKVEIIFADHQNKADVGSQIARQWYDAEKVTADYAFGHALERDTEAVVVKTGGKVLGKVRHPLNNQDFSSFLLQAQASKAKIIGLANARGDPPTRSSRAPSSASSRAGRTSPGCSCSSPTSTRSASTRRRG